MCTTDALFAGPQRGKKFLWDSGLLKNNSDRQINARAPEGCTQIAK